MTEQITNDKDPVDVNCKHEYRLFSLGANGPTFGCHLCGHAAERSFTAVEQWLWKDYLVQSKTQVKELHKSFWSFMRATKDESISGYDLMEVVDKWIQEHPEATLTYCDDDKHTSSYLVLIPYRTATKFMGTTVVYIPQNGDPNQRMTTFFLYNNHLLHLVKSLQVYEQPESQWLNDLYKNKHPIWNIKFEETSDGTSAS